MKINEIVKETATAGATSAGNVATGVVATHGVGNSYTGSPGKSGKKAPKTAKVVQPKKKDGTAVNALDMKSNLMGGSNPQGFIKR
jgi:hypothetical protein